MKLIITGEIMGLNSGIEWTTHTLNFWIGCTKVAAGCLHCYAEREMKRYGLDFKKVGRTAIPTWNQVKKYKPGDKVFVCSWSDFFHKDADQWRNEAWEVIKSRPDVTFLILTKRLDRVHPDSIFPKNVWLGASASTSKEANEQIGMLLLFDVSIRFMSFEPLLEDITNINIEPLDWAIISCESGPKRRPCKLEWVGNIVQQCYKAARVLIFVKQLSINGKVNRNPADWPEYLRLREYPD